MVSFASEADALKYKRAAERVAVGRTVGSAVSEYLEHLRADVVRGRVRRESTVKLAEWRLVAFLRLADGGDRPLTGLTRTVAVRLLERRAGEVKPDTLAGELATAARWARWLATRGALQGDPFKDLVAPGERSRGKPQLRTDAARRFLATALGEGSDAGLAAALALLTGMRAGEVTGLQVRDLDDGGRVIWISRAKTRAGERRLEVPQVLRERLAKLTEGRAADAQIFGDVDRYWLGYHVPRLCELAGVDRVTPHGLRGTFATLAVAALPTTRVAEVMGHAHTDVTRDAYLAPGAEQSAAARRLETDLVQPLPAGDPTPTGVN